MTDAIEQMGRVYFDTSRMGFTETADAMSAIILGAGAEYPISCGGLGTSREVLRQSAYDNALDEQCQLAQP